MPYVPGDNWCICDLTGKKVLMSETRKTWDGLRVWKEVWYPKHPQLTLRAIPDRMAVIDGRPRPADIYTNPYGVGSFTLDPGGTTYIVYADDDGNLLTAAGLLGTPVKYLDIGSWRLSVTGAGLLYATSNPGTGIIVKYGTGKKYAGAVYGAKGPGVAQWIMTSFDGTQFYLIIDGPSYPGNIYLTPV